MFSREEGLEKINDFNAGRVAERFKAPVLKTGRGRELPREFESHPFRQYAASRCFVGLRCNSENNLYCYISEA